MDSVVLKSTIHNVRSSCGYAHGWLQKVSQIKQCQIKTYAGLRGIHTLHQWFQNFSSPRTPLPLQQHNAHSRALHLSTFKSSSYQLKTETNIVTCLKCFNVWTMFTKRFIPVTTHFLTSALHRQSWLSQHYVTSTDIRKKFRVQNICYININYKQFVQNIKILNTTSGSGFPSNVTLFWIFYSVTATCFGLMTIFKRIPP
jgi:hypothetical protein